MSLPRIRLSTLTWAVLCLVPVAPVVAQSRQDDSKSPAQAPWRWADDKRQPFHPWHNDSAVQTQLYDDAYQTMRAKVGVELSEPVEIIIVPVGVFPLLAMEMGAKSGSLLHDHTTSRAFDWLGFASTADRQRGKTGDEIVAEASKNEGPAGMYFPLLPVTERRKRAMGRQIFLSADLAPDGVMRVLEHELVHAMQDAAYGFSTWIENGDQDLDVHYARSAVEEGFAMLMANPEMLDAARDEGGGATGSNFCCLLEGQEGRMYGFTHMLGGAVAKSVRMTVADDHALLATLFGQPPGSTREILHPELYLARLEERTPLESSASAATSDAGFTQLVQRIGAGVTRGGWKPASETSCGEFFLFSLLVELDTPCAGASSLASHWRADHLVTVDSPHGTYPRCSLVAAVWLLDSDEGAASLAGALEEALASRGAGAPKPSRDSSVQQSTRVFEPESPDLPRALIERQGRCIVYVAGEDVGPMVEELVGGG